MLADAPLGPVVVAVFDEPTGATSACVDAVCPTPRPRAQLCERWRRPGGETYLVCDESGRSRTQR